MEKIKNSLFYILLVLLPKNLVSRLMGSLVSREWPPFLARFINRLFVAGFKLDMQDAEFPLDHYTRLQDLFVRRLKPNLRPISIEKNVIISPCDGLVGALGKVEKGRLVQAKGKLYSLSNFVQSKELAQKFEDGDFVTLYLSPRDYHRFHVPMTGIITKTIYVPGALWPVNQWAVTNIKELFCQNERFITVIENSQTGLSLAHVAVGATMVGRMTLAYGSLDNRHELNDKINKVNKEKISVRMGDDLGQFMFGSTIVLLFEKGLIDHLVLAPRTAVKMGQALAIMK